MGFCPSYNESQASYEIESFVYRIIANHYVTFLIEMVIFMSVITTVITAWITSASFERERDRIYQQATDRNDVRPHSSLGNLKPR